MHGNCDYLPEFKDQVHSVLAPTGSVPMAMAQNVTPSPSVPNDDEYEC